MSPHPFTFTKEQLEEGAQEWRDFRRWQHFCDEWRLIGWFAWDADYRARLLFEGFRWPP